MTERTRIFVGSNDSKWLREQAALEKKKGTIVGTDPADVLSQMHGTDPGSVEIGGGLFGICVTNLAKTFARRGKPVTLDMKNIRLGEESSDLSHEKLRELELLREQAELSGDWSFLENISLK